VKTVFPQTAVHIGSCSDKEGENIKTAARETAGKGRVSWEKIRRNAGLQEKGEENQLKLT